MMVGNFYVLHFDKRKKRKLGLFVFLREKKINRKSFCNRILIKGCKSDTNNFLMCV